MYRLLDIIDREDRTPIHAKEVGQFMKSFTAEVGEQLVLHFTDGKHLRYGIVKSVEENEWGAWVSTQDLDIAIEDRRNLFNKKVDF